MNNPIESDEFKGFYEIPNYSKYVISKKGVIINKSSGLALNGSVNPAGYVNFRITGDNGYTMTWGRHRLLGYVFMFPGDNYINLVINHKDGIKGHDDLDNLEWVTYQQNQEHAGLNDLTKKCCPISVRDVVTGNILKFPSIVKCAKYFDTSKDSIIYRLKIGESRIFPELRQYRFGHDDDTWYIPDNLYDELLVNGNQKSVLMRDVFTNEITRFEKMSDLAKFMGISIARLSVLINKPNQPVIHGFRQIKYESNKEPWRHVDDPYFELDISGIRRVIVTTNSNTGEKNIYLSANDCARKHKLLSTTLNWRLKQSPFKIYSDGFSYSYYSNLYGPTNQQ